MQEHFLEQMLPSIVTIPNDFVFIIEVIKSSFSFSCTSTQLKGSVEKGR